MSSPSPYASIRIARGKTFVNTVFEAVWGIFKRRREIIFWTGPGNKRPYLLAWKEDHG
jgi:hypothetical protein